MCIRDRNAGVSVVTTAFTTFKTSQQIIQAVPVEYVMQKGCLLYTSSSITRFVRTLGYDSYKEFKSDIDHTLTIDVDYSKPVSYTHLDVYKRQVLVCADAAVLLLMVRSSLPVLMDQTLMV